MALDVLSDCTLTGPALPEPFVRFELEKALTAAGLLPKTSGAEGRALQESWEVYLRILRELVLHGGGIRVRNHILDPLVDRLGYERIELAPEVETREGREAGGELFVDKSGTARLRTWAVGLDEDLDAPAKRGRAYRFSHTRIAQRVLLASGERIGLLTNGAEIRILLSDPARPDSQIIVPLDPHWRRSRQAPDSYRLLLALASPKGAQAIPDLVEKARLQQTRVTKELRSQAREAVSGFVQEVLDHPENRGALAAVNDKGQLARELWHEGLVLVYRLLVILKLESTDDPARSFRFASSSLWRQSFSPTTALAPVARAVIEQGSTSGRMLEDGLRTLFQIFDKGLESTELHVEPLGGALFGVEQTPRLTGLRWGERAPALLLYRLLWSQPRRGAEAMGRVHYGPLDVEDLGRVYEALLELDPGISTEPMCRLRRQKLEVVVPAVQGERHRPAAPPREDATEDDSEDEETEETDETAEETAPRGKKAKVEWVEEIPTGRFFLRVGLGRKASGSYYTPHSFVRFLVQETLGPQVAERSPREDPKPGEILKLKVLDPAMGSGHFLVEACRFLGERLYEAARLCDERAYTAQRKAESARTRETREEATREAEEYSRRIRDLPDREDELLKYLPSRAPEGEESGLSQRRAEAICRRLVAVHCLYGVDRNPLAVELARVSLWIESHAEGLPLTFLDHRLVLGDSLAGPRFSHLFTYPGSREPIGHLLETDIREAVTESLRRALGEVAKLEATVGLSIADIEVKRAAKARLDLALAPLRLVAAAWSGGVMLGDLFCDDSAYGLLLREIGRGVAVPTWSGRLPEMVACGLGLPVAEARTAPPLESLKHRSSVPALPFDLSFPEVFFPYGEFTPGTGFDAVLGNPPWDTITIKRKEWFAAFDFGVLEATTKRDRDAVEQRVLARPKFQGKFETYVDQFERRKRTNDVLYEYQKVFIDGDLAGRFLDEFRVFMERNAQLLGSKGATGVVVPSAFHANEGATGVRRLYLEKMSLRLCYSFENQHRLFDIHRSFKFAVVVADGKGPTQKFSSAFYLVDDEWLFGDRGDQDLSYTLSFVRATGGQYLSFLELRGPADLQAASVLFASPLRIGAALTNDGIQLSVELNSTKDSGRFVSTSTRIAGDPRDPALHAQLLAAGYLILVEGKHLWQAYDLWGQGPRYLVPVDRLADRPQILRAAQFYRIGFRDISGSGNERTCVFAMVPPGCVFSDTVKAPERTPWARNNSAALKYVGLANSFSFDFMVRLNAGSHVGLFMLENLPCPDRLPSLVPHATLRLVCNHAGFAPLWAEQVGTEWREAAARVTWPVLGNERARWDVLAPIDAVVAKAFGLKREEYKHVLGTFPHKTFAEAPILCLTRFDELEDVGLEAFSRKYDPYWDIPVRVALASPVIDIRAQQGPSVAGMQLGLGFGVVETQLPLPSSGLGRRVAQPAEPFGPSDGDEGDGPALPGRKRRPTRRRRS